MVLDVCRRWDERAKERGMIRRGGQMNIDDVREDRMDQNTPLVDLVFSLVYIVGQHDLCRKTTEE